MSRTLVESLPPPPGHAPWLPAGADDLKRVWEKEELDWRRALLSAVLERVEVGSAVKGRNFFDPGRVRIIWRF
jgi:hypothetical protein